jgi:hypothetical protein
MKNNIPHRGIGVKSGILAIVFVRYAMGIGRKAITLIFFDTVIDLSLQLLDGWPSDFPI